MEKYSQFRDRGNSPPKIQVCHMLILYSDGYRALSFCLDTRISGRNIHPRRYLPLPPAILHHLFSRLLPLLPLPSFACYL